jgi:hypothetical protein
MGSTQIDPRLDGGFSGTGSTRVDTFLFPLDAGSHDPSEDERDPDGQRRELRLLLAPVHRDLRLLRI